MIPIELTIQGLYSYQEKQTIDFTRLTAANLFGIFGTVGSGKSSILEAITYAIYGRTTRLNQSGDNRYYNMLNLKSDELLIDFIFETGRNQTAFRATVKGKRNSKNFEDVKATVRTAYKMVNNQWIPVEPEELELAIGLSYDNFRRTIIIPQGQFQEFLQLGNKDRTQMMKELFDLGKYEFYYKVTSLESKNNAGKQNIEGQLQQLGEMDTNQEKQLEEQLKTLKGEIAELNQNLDRHQIKDEELKKLRQLTEKLKDAALEFDKLKEQEPSIIRIEETIENFEKCHYLFKHLLDAVESSSKRIAVKGSQIKMQEDELVRLDTEYSTLEKQLAEVKPVYDKRDELKQQAEELGLLVRIRKLESEINNDETRLNNGMEVLNRTIGTIEQLKNEKHQLEATLKLQKEKLPDMNVLADIRAWHIEDAGIRKQLAETDTQLEKCRQEKSAVYKEMQGILSDPVFEGNREQTDLDVLLKLLEINVVGYRQKLRVLETEASELAVKARLHQYAGELHDGKACPLCGSLSHPEVYTAENIRELQLGLQEKKDRLEKNIDRCHSLSGNLNDLSRKLQYNETQVQEWQAKKETGLSAQKIHNDAFVWEKYKIKEELDAAFKVAVKVNSAIEETEHALKAKIQDLEKEQNNRERYKLTLDQITTDLTTLRTEKRTLSEHLKLVVPMQYAEMDIPEIEQESKVLTDEYKRIKEEFVNLNSLFEKNRSNAASLAGGLEANRNELSQEKEILQQQSEKLDEQLRNTKYNTLDEVRHILAQSLEPETEKKKINAFRHQQVVLLKNQEQLQQEIGDRTYDPGQHALLTEEIKKFKQDSVSKNQELGKTEELLNKLRQDLKKQKELKAELRKLELRAENIRTMKSLFKASGFVNYISSVYLQNLCVAANERFFQLTRQKLSLEITPDNNFQVRDFMNGGKVRSVKTLSGGQTFQAALSLALALADNIQKITESNQNFFFLDEGFGSLDRESLAVVFDTLKTLRKENRIVGVISHVEEMQQEIDMYLQIENHEDKGSIIKPCWNS